MSTYVPGMREYDASRVTEKQQARLTCWHYLNEGKDCCIRERGHDDGIHEAGPESNIDLEQWQERLDAALKRAAEMVAVCEPMYIAGFPHGDEAVTQVMPDCLAGWVEAVKALATHLPHPKYTLRCLACDAITKFCDTILGGTDGST